MYYEKQANNCIFLNTRFLKKEDHYPCGRKPTWKRKYNSLICPYCGQTIMGRNKEKTIYNWNKQNPV